MKLIKFSQVIKFSFVLGISVFNNLAANAAEVGGPSIHLTDGSVAASPIIAALTPPLHVKGATLSIGSNIGTTSTKGSTGPIPSPPDTVDVGVGRITGQNILQVGVGNNALIGQLRLIYVPEYGFRGIAITVFPTGKRSFSHYSWSVSGNVTAVMIRTPVGHQLLEIPNGLSVPSIGNSVPFTFMIPVTDNSNSLNKSITVTLTGYSGLQTAAAHATLTINLHYPLENWKQIGEHPGNTQRYMDIDVPDDIAGDWEKAVNVGSLTMHSHEIPKVAVAVLQQSGILIGAGESPIAGYLFKKLGTKAATAFIPEVGWAFLVATLAEEAVHLGIKWEMEEIENADHKSVSEIWTDAIDFTKAHGYSIGTRSAWSGCIFNSKLNLTRALDATYYAYWTMTKPAYCQFFAYFDYSAEKWTMSGYSGNVTKTEPLYDRSALVGTFTENPNGPNFVNAAI